MIKRIRGYLAVRRGDVPQASAAIEAQGYAVLRQVFAPDEVAKLAAQLRAVYESDPPDVRERPDWEREDFRYAMLNRSALAQQAVGHPRILETLEPLLGDDCHVIANTCWRNPPNGRDGDRGGFWHIDAGPHVPRPEGVAWPDSVPYPVFAIGAHLLLQDCPLDCGPTGVIPRSHRSGRTPPRDQPFADDLEHEGAVAVALDGRAGDVALFASDIWHRRLPTGPGDTGRFFLQAHYGRRDIAQRLRTTAEVNQVSPQAIERAGTDERARSLIGLHAPMFYDG
ncbi:MAG: phytanoyl-CoA dioxygenase family protein [Deltaproteobacteria bacterium]|nr:phytanoyl-CoA dioxygenase family protein [Deltaproteobacteria bacterium]MBW2416089.1 phytanoyl-CoA dioxygenase family protein [Deltaproteobacteria bacterium]